MNSQQRPPSDLTPGGRGRKVWRRILEALELDVHEAALLHEAARCLDTLDTLDELTRRAGVMLADGRIAPWVVESRQQRIAYSRLIASLRLPADLAEPERRPQRRSATRGVYHPRLTVVGAAQ